MRTGAKFFVLSSAFAVATAAAYWFSSYEPAGTALLASMGLAPGLVAAFLAKRSHAPHPAADRPDARPGDAAGQEIGPFASVSAWPVVFGAGAMLVAGGLAYGTWLLVVAIVFVVGLVGFVRE